MPTPFYHLSIAEELFAHPDIPSSSCLSISEHPGAFLLGNTAPDVQVVSGQTREATHFFTLPVKPGARPPWDQLLISHPSLAQPEQLSQRQVAFIAGYLCHLQADWIWVKDIFIPIFGPQCRWGSFRQRLYLHNVLRAYLDRQIIPDLSHQTLANLQSISPHAWLPFVDDPYLRVWRDDLTSQLEPGVESQTVEVFAARQGISPSKYYRLLESETRMNEEVFSHLPRGRLIEYRIQLIEENLDLLETYLNRIDTRVIIRSQS